MMPNLQVTHPSVARLATPAFGLVSFNLASGQLNLLFVNGSNTRDNLSSYVKPESGEYGE